MSDIRAVFPQRPLKLRQPIGAWRGRLLGLLGLLVFGGFVAWFGFALGPDLASDFAIRDTARPLRDARLVEGRCSSRAVILHDCTLTLSQRGKDRELRREVHYLFVDFHMGAYTVNQVLGDPNRPETLTTDIGMDRLWNRAISMAVMAFFGLAMVFGIFKAAGAAGPQRRLVQAMSGKLLSPVPLRLLGRGPQGWDVVAPDGQRRMWRVPGRARPFVLDPAQGTILGVIAPGAPGAMPLDEKLRWVKLSTAEQVAMQAYRTKV